MSHLQQSASTLERLSTELLRKIVYFATDRDGEDPSHSWPVTFPSRKESMNVKRAVSSVSRRFHAISAEFLYEVISIRRLEACIALNQVFDAIGPNVMSSTIYANLLPIAVDTIRTKPKEIKTYCDSSCQFSARLVDSCLSVSLFKCLQI